MGMIRMHTTESTQHAPQQSSVPNENVVSIRRAVIDYQLKRHDIRAIADVNLTIKRGKITALVGESGSGKTTLASSILNCISEPGKLVDGEVVYYGRTPEERIVVNQLSKKEAERFRWSKVSMVFQGAQSALNPVMTIFEQFKETMKVHGWDKRARSYEARSREVLETVNLSADRVLKMYPHELSGGMKQRVMIAFSLLLSPDLIILDEPTTALDVITQHYIFNILKDINERMGISMLLLTHDIAIVAKFADYVGVMYAGQMMEFGDTLHVFANKLHPYTRGLINATPTLHGPIEAMKPIEGSPPDLRKPPAGCRFHPRCPQAVEACRTQVPDDVAVKAEYLVKCQLYAPSEQLSSEGGHRTS